VYFSRNTSTPGNPSKGDGQVYSSGWAGVRHAIAVDYDGDGKDDIVGRIGDNMYVWRSTSTATTWSLQLLADLGAGASTASKFLMIRGA
jgi:hypothetical protein